MLVKHLDERTTGAAADLERELHFAPLPVFGIQD